MHYLVCGGAGFIGINLCRYLLKLGHNVTVWDNKSTGDVKNLPKQVNFVNIDIENIYPKSYSGIYDGIFNLACPASPEKYQANPIKTVKTCVLGTCNLLDIAQYSDIPIVHASTSEVYGNTDICPQKEDNLGSVNFTGIRACYDEGKRTAETLCFDHNRTRNTKVIIVRIFNTYGPYMSPSDGRVISNFITQTLSDKPLSIYGDGSQTRSFCYVDDTVLGLVAAMNSGKIGPFNIGNPDEKSIIEIATIIHSKIPNSNNRVIFKDLPQDDPVRRCPDIKKANNELGWFPQVSFEEGILKTIEYYKENHIKIGIVGGGMVGMATALFGLTKNISVIIYDICRDRCKPESTELIDLLHCDMIFVCVPTPSTLTGECDTSIVEKVVQDIKLLADTEQSSFSCPPIILRSTVPPGTSDRLGVTFCPEFLTEKNWQKDFRATKTWLIGNKLEIFSKLIQRSYDSGVIVSRDIKIVSNSELELIKYARNSFLAVKVAYFNDIYKLTEKLDMDWNVVRENIVADERIGESHSNVPGHDGKFGFGGNCLPKDIKAIRIFSANAKIPQYVLSGAIISNEHYRKSFL